MAKAAHTPGLKTLCKDFDVCAQPIFDAVDVLAKQIDLYTDSYSTLRTRLLIAGSAGGVVAALIVAEILLNTLRFALSARRCMWLPLGFALASLQLSEAPFFV